MDGKFKGIGSRSPDSLYIDFVYNGKRYRETLPIKPTKTALKEMARKREAILHDISIGTFDYAKHFPTSKYAHLGKSSQLIKIETLLDDYIETHRKRSKKSTWKDYRSAINYHLKPQFGDLYIQQLTVSEINKWINTLDISNKRINNIMIPLRGICWDAYKDELIDRNPMERIKNLEVRQDEPDPFSPDEMMKILQACTGQIKNLFQFAFSTGLRTSELIALEWGDVDWNESVVRIRRAKVRGEIKVTKTYSSERDIKLSSWALAALKSQKEYTHLKGKEVFHNPRTDEPWKDDAPIRRTAWQPALKRAGVRLRNPYQTRHTYASVLLSQGVNPMFVAQQMGHKDWGMIRKRYGRWIPEIDTSSGDKIEAFWSQYSHKGQANA